jgi:NAD-dependent dihydropyrimidine dehydrogenase PreA subunit
MRRTKDLVAQYIDLTKYDVSYLNKEMAPNFSQAIVKTMKGIRKAARDYKKELSKDADDLKNASKEFWDEVIEMAKTLNIDLIGFAPVDENLIFTQDQTSHIEQLYENGIILGMEMDFNAIDLAPGPEAGLEAQIIYAELGEATNKIADFIRSKGFNAIACHPLGGPILYTAMAAKANLGELGRNGLIISKKYGPRQRWSMISTTANPLPESIEEIFKISEYGKKCGACIRACPTNAIFEEPIVNDNGTITSIDVDKCFPQFYKTAGCSICIKFCPFHKSGYDALIK